MAQTGDTITSTPPGTHYNDTIRYESGMIRYVIYRSSDSALIRVISFYDNAHQGIERVENYKNDILHGWQISWYENGYTKTHTIFWYGILAAETAWDLDGRKTSITFTDNSGVTTSKYFYPTDTVKMIIKSKNSAVFFSEQFCENGQLQFQFYSDSSYQHRQYYCSGSLMLTCAINKKGAFVGKFTKWYEDGTIAESGAFLKHEDSVPIKHGVWLYYNEKGKLTKKEKYSKGKLLDKKVM